MVSVFYFWLAIPWECRIPTDVKAGRVRALYRFAVRDIGRIVFDLFFNLAIFCESITPGFCKLKPSSLTNFGILIYFGRKFRYFHIEF